MFGSEVPKYLMYTTSVTPDHQDLRTRLLVHLHHLRRQFEVPFVPPKAKGD